MNGSQQRNWPRITVVTPVLNGAEHLAETIDSVLEQRYPDLEYIVVDGGSTDGTVQIVESYRPHIARFIQGRDCTMYDAVAKGFEAATGEIFCWLNSDDMFTPGILERIGRLFAEHPDWQVIHGDDTVWKQGWHVAHRPQRPVQLPELLARHVLPQASTFFRRSAYEAVGGLEREALPLAADYHLWLRLAMKYEFHFVPIHASVFRIRPRQLSGDWARYTEEMRRAAGEMAQALPADYLKQTRLERARRSVEARRLLRARRLLYPLADERLNWPRVKPAPHQPLDECRCPICGQYPSHLLFSSPDARFGDRTLWRVYHCDQCHAAFRFPRAELAMLQAIRQRVNDPDFVDLPDVPPGVYSPFRQYSVLRGRLTYRPLAALAATDPAASANEDLQLPREPKSAAILAVDAWGTRSADYLRAAGFTQVVGHDIWQPLPESGSFDAIMLGQSLQHRPDPVRWLGQLRALLKPGGRVYLSIPSLDSRWLAIYGPCWSQWHLPFHAVLVGRRGLAEMARRAGYRLTGCRTNSPRRWLYMSDQLASRGLASHVLGDFARIDQRLWTAACGAAVAGRWDDWRGRGDCLHACLIPE